MDLDALALKVFTLMVKVRLFRRLERSRGSEQSDLSEREFLALELLSQNAPMRECYFGKWMGLQSTSLQELVNRLSAARFISKVRPKSDRRLRLLELTDEGRRFLNEQRINGARRYTFLFDGLSNQIDIDSFIAVLELVEENITSEMQECAADYTPAESLHAIDTAESTLKGFWTGIRL